LENSRQRKQAVSAIDAWKQEIRDKGERARDLSKFEHGSAGRKPRKSGKPAGVRQSK
jgi:hypothetical protein